MLPLKNCSNNRKAVEPTLNNCTTFTFAFHCAAKALVFLQTLNFWYSVNYLVKINTFNFSSHNFWLLLPHVRGGKIKKINATAKINWKISMKSKGIETSGASADNSAKLCTDRPATVEEVTSLVNTTS